MNNFRKSLTATLLLVAFSVAAVFGQTGHGYDRASLDPNTAACTDFYQYANGGWMAANPIPAAYSSWGVANLLDEHNRDMLHEILEAAAKNTKAVKGSSEQKVGDYYATCMDESAIEAAGLTPLGSELDRIAKLTDQKSLQEEITHLHAIGLNILFVTASTQDFKNSAEVTADIDQGGLGLPDRDYYLKTDDKSKGIREAYVAHVAKMFELMGDDGTKAAAEAQTVVALETKLAEASMTRVERREPANLYHRMTVAQLHDLGGGFNWSTYFQKIGVPAKTDVNVESPGFFKELDKQLTAAPIADWQTYLRWHLINNAATGLSAKFVDEDFNFKGKTLQGSKENLPRWKRCAAGTDRVLGEALGEVYVKKAFPPAAKARALQMVRNLEAALKTDITTLSWMSDPTRKQAIVKLDAFLNKIGYPDKWRDYSALNVDRTSYVSNRFRAAAFGKRRDLNKIGKPVDKTEWGMSPPTVNAYYNPQINEIVFPAGILQPPFFDAEADDAFNYGGMGSVIGHEMTHGFDDEGSQFDSTGNLANWWSDADKKEFTARAQCVIDQFNTFEVEKGLNENGKLVAGESIADLGGLVVAYAAFQKAMEGKPRVTIDGFTPEQRFFLGYARGWATNMRPELQRMLVNIDPHPLAKFRVNGPLANMPQFAEAFQCKASDAMVRGEAKRCVIW
ncbi:MAG TPA: M13 family metallopeptidase [Pyrinomonadaceae bacterium]|jgi:putative endopeptidase|nr:M13 family metallopeptidase [Pyrinomonadaceae bacterium]